MARCFLPFERSHTSHCGLKWSEHFVPIHEANPSLSQRLSHHAIVTRSPNHWCAISCASTSKILSFVFSDDFAGSNKRMLSKYVMPPQFSIAPPKPPGTAIKSSFGSGYLIPKYSL